jgi:hypothetical protein
MMVTRNDPAGLNPQRFVLLSREISMLISAVLLRLEKYSKVLLYCITFNMGNVKQARR